MSCWPSWPFAARPRFIAGRDLGSRPLVPNVGLVGFLLSATAASKGRERKARDVRCHKIASDPICFGPLYNETQLFLGFLEISKLLFREVCLFVCTVVCVCVLGSIAASIKAVRGKDKMQFVIK